MDGSDLPTTCTDRHGHEAWTATWSGSKLDELRVRLPNRDVVVVRGHIGEHAVFGPCGGVFVPGETEPRCRFPCIDWAAPECIMPLDVPAAVPSGAGTAILNVVATLARRAGRTTLRYRGPYPTAALFDTLVASFRCALPVAEALAAFTADAEGRAARAEMTEVPVDFVVAPHAWVWTAPGVCVQIRDEVERVYVHGKSYDRLLSSHRTLVRSEGDGVGWCGRIELAGRPWAEVITVDPRGEVLDGPHPLPELSGTLLGTQLPGEVVEVLGQIIASRATPALRAAVLAEVGERSVVWVDTGADLGRLAPERFELHAELGARLPALEPQPMLVYLGGALEPLVLRAAQARLAAAAGA